MRKRQQSKKFLYTFLLVSTIALSLALPHFASAARLFPSIVPNCDQTLIFNASTSTYTTNGQCTFSDFIQMFVNLFDWGLAILSVLSVAFFIIGGLILMLSGGNENSIKTGKSILVNTVLGVAIALCSWLIINSVIGFLVGTGSLKNVQVFGKLWWGVPSCASSYSSNCSRNNLHAGCGDVKTTYVAELQRKLNAAPGCPGISVDGCFGSDTEAAVQTFNIAAVGTPLGPTQSKIANSDTWAALDAGKSCQIAVNTKNPRPANPPEMAGCCITACSIQGMEGTPEIATNPADGEGCKDLLPDALWYSGVCRDTATQTDGCCISLKGDCYDTANADWCLDGSAGGGTYWHNNACSELGARCKTVRSCSQ